MRRPRGRLGFPSGSITLGLSPYFRCKSKEKAKHPRSELIFAVGERLIVGLKGWARSWPQYWPGIFNPLAAARTRKNRSYLQADFARFKLLPACSTDSFGTMETTM